MNESRDRQLVANKSILTWVAIALAAALGLFAIWILKDGRPPLGAEQDPGVMGREVFEIGLVGRGEINTLDPARAATEAPIQIIWNIFDRLVQMGPDDQLQPMLAVAWQSSDDLTEWRFDLRENVVFHATGWGSGQALDPGDVKYSIERAVRIPGYSRSLVADVIVGVDDFLTGKTRGISGIRVTRNQVIFQLSKPFAFFPDRLATSYMSIVPRGSPDEGQLPAGTGAFEVDKWDGVRQTAALRLSQTYWANVAADVPKRVIVRAIDNEALAASELKTGGVDWLEFNSSAFGAVQKGLDAAARIAPYQHTELRLIAINVNAAPFDAPDGPRLRVALNLGIHRKALIDMLDGGTPFAGPVPLAEFSDMQLSYDPDRARALVSGIPVHARKLTMLVEPVDEARFIANVLVKQWRAIGLDVTAEPGRADFFDRAVSGKYQLALAYYGPFIPSPEQYLWMYRELAIPVPNVMRFKSPAFERAFNSYVTLRDREARETALRAALSVLLDNPPTIWILQPPRFVATTTAFHMQRSAGLPNYRTLTTTAKLQ